MMDGEDGEKQRWYKCKQQLEICNKERQDDDVSHGKNPKRLEKVQELFYQPVLLSERELHVIDDTTYMNNSWILPYLLREDVVKKVPEMGHLGETKGLKGSCLLLKQM